MEGLLPLLLAIALPTVVFLIGFAVRALVKKYNLSAVVDEEQLINNIVTTATNAVEQLSAVMQAKQGEKIASEDKMAMAIDFITKQIDSLGLKKAAQDVLKMKVEAILNEQAL